MPHYTSCNASTSGGELRCTSGSDFCTALADDAIDGEAPCTDRFVSLFQIRAQHVFDPFHECADPARQIVPMGYDEGHGERPATKIG